MEKTKLKKKPARHVLILVPVILLLLAALVYVSTLYARSITAPEEEIVSDAPAAAASAAPAASPAPTPAPTPYVPQQLTFDIVTSDEVLDIVVCDTEGLVVPGFAFPLEIRYEDGESHSVLTDINGRYYAEYLIGGEYTVSMPPFEGFSVPESTTCRVEDRPASTAPYDAETLFEINGLDPYTEPDPAFLYRYEVGENGYLLLADGTESDVLPVEEDGVLVFGERSTVLYYRSDGTPTTPEELGDDDVEWTDYYTEKQTERIELILADGVVNDAFAVTAERNPDAAPPRLRTGWIEIDGRTYYANKTGQLVTGLKNIEGKLYFFDPDGVKAAKLGIDVSYFNSAIDWNAVKAGGIDFAIVRVAGRTWEKGLLFEDEDSYRQGTNGGFYLQGAKEAGLEVGAYFYSNAINAKEAVEEAEFALDILKRSGVTLDMPIYYDLEYSGEYPRGRADRLNLIQRAAVVKAFCGKIEEAGYQAGVYAGEYFFSRSLRLADVAPYKVWYAVYTNNFALPDYRGFDIWQFSESIRINGMPDETDMNVIF